MHINVNEWLVIFLFGMSSDFAVSLESTVCWHFRKCQIFLFSVAGVSISPTWTVFISSAHDRSVQQCTMKSSLATWSMPNSWVTPWLTFGPAHLQRVMTTFSTVTHQSRRSPSPSVCRIGTRRCLTRPSLKEWWLTTR